MLTVDGRLALNAAQSKNYDEYLRNHTSQNENVCITDNSEHASLFPLRFGYIFSQPETPKTPTSANCSANSDSGLNGGK